MAPYIVLGLIVVAVIAAVVRIRKVDSECVDGGCDENKACPVADKQAEVPVPAPKKAKKSKKAAK